MRLPPCLFPQLAQADPWLDEQLGGWFEETFIPHRMLVPDDCPGIYCGIEVAAPGKRELLVYVPVVPRVSTGPLLESDLKCTGHEPFFSLSALPSV